MYNSFQLAKKYIQYWWNASNGKGHGVHSPFVFEFIIKVLNDAKSYDGFDAIEKLRSQLHHNNTLLIIEDFGAGSRTGATKQRSVQSIARAALKPKKFAQLLHRIARFYECKTIVELGTSLGITSAYLAQSPATQKLYTLEGSPAIASVAKQNFEALTLTNIEQVVGNFDETLAPLLQRSGPVDLLYIDGNHRYEPTIRYFEQAFPHLHEYSIVVFDDIHWSAEMEQAWHQVIADERVTMSIDLFFIGLVFFRKDFKIKQDFGIRF
ncbi:MAG TPA: class I SAM-dependent methyltransferase [Phnomibacter sp.]|nr:class I SAM-dependent methyltransferase [Phnomibacter sp.]